MTTADTELVDIVDEHDAVITTVTRAEMRADNLRHRSVFVVVVDLDGLVVVHQRAPWKDRWPGMWDVAFGGVVAAGESWEQAAGRELAEEAGVQAELEPLADGRYESHEVREVARVYLARHGGPFTFADGEVVAIDRVEAGRLRDWCTVHPICPDSTAVVLPALLARLEQP